MVCLAAIPVHGMRAYERRTRILARYAPTDAVVLSLSRGYSPASKTSMRSWNVTVRYAYSVGGQVFSGSGGRSYLREEEADYAALNHWAPQSTIRVWFDPLSPSSSTLEPDPGEPPPHSWLVFFLGASGSVIALVWSVLIVRSWSSSLRK